jgi:rhodanese-related sulfurtransferase
MPSSPRFSKLVDAAKSQIREVSATEAKGLQERGALLIDVRESEDFEKGHATDAIHLSRGILEMKIEDVAPDLSSPIICYCGGGSRSALAVESLQKMGYANTVSMSGGFKAWKENKLPVQQPVG